jgi:hypothetical protein
LNITLKLFSLYHFHQFHFPPKNLKRRWYKTYFDKKDLEKIAFIGFICFPKKLRKVGSDLPAVYPFISSTKYMYDDEALIKFCFLEIRLQVYVSVNLIWSDLTFLTAQRKCNRCKWTQQKCRLTFVNVDVDDCANLPRIYANAKKSSKCH